MSCERETQDFGDRLNSLPTDLEYFGEFGAELVLALPFFNWLSRTGNLKNRRLITYAGMRCFYDEMDCLEIVEKTAKRGYIRPENRPVWLPVRNEHSFGDFQPSALHLWPDLRAKFHKLPLLPDLLLGGKPLLIVHNKYCDEWNVGPVNFISVEILEQIFSRMSEKFTIVYIRHGKLKADGFSEDHNTLMDMNDQILIDRYDDVHDFDELYKRHLALGGDNSLNTFKNILYSRCYHFITSQGGGAHHIALYSGSLMSIMHRRGKEEKWAYDKGYYGFMAPVPPIRAICRNDDDMLCSIELFVHSTIVDRRSLVSASDATTLRALSPSSVKSRNRT